MPIATTGMLVTIAFQVGSSVFSQIYGKRNNDEVKKLQRDAQIDAQKQDFEREMEKYHRSCKYQIELEADAHQERLKGIETEFEGAFKKMAHASALNRYPLNISPYLIKKNILNFDSVSPSEIRPDLFCILSCGDEPLFNRDIFPFLDNLLNSYLSCYWNTNTTHRICYYEGLWNRDVSYDTAHVANLQAMLPAPILMVSPRLQKRNDGYKLTFDFNFWGCGPSKSINFEPDNLPSLRPQNGKKYSKEEIKDILEKVAPGLICMIGYYADNYYWANYYEQPLLPTLLASKGFIGDDKLLNDYREAYKDMLDVYVSGQCESVNPEVQEAVMNDVAKINNYYFPERSVSLLEGISPLLSQNEIATKKKPLIVQCVNRSIPHYSNKEANALCEFLISNKKEPLPINFYIEDIGTICNYKQFSSVYDEKASLILSAKKTVRNLKFAYNLSEVLEVLTNSNYDEYVLSIKDKFVISLAIFNSKNYMGINCYYVHEIPQKYIGKVLKYDVANKTLVYSDFPLPVLQGINNIFISKEDEANIACYSSFYEQMIEKGREYAQYHKDIIDKIENKVITEKTINNWIKINYREGDKLLTEQFIIGDYFFIISLLINENFPVYERYIGMKCFHIDETLSRKMKFTVSRLQKIQ